MARATRRGVVAAPRAMPLHFPEQAQHLVCELLCDLRLAELDADDDERSRLERYKRSPHKVLKELETARHCPSAAAAAAAPPPPRAAPAAKLSGRVRLNLCREAKGGKGGGAKLLVVERSDDVDVLLKKAKKLLSTKREPKFAYEEATGLELRDTRTIENDTRVCVADALPSAAPPPPPPPPEKRRGVKLGSSRAAAALEDAPDPNDRPPSFELAAGPPLPPAAVDGAAAAAMAEQRAKLPAYRARGELRAALAAGPVAVVAGATGCGKSTQVPQLLLEDADADGRRCKVVVTQPRRVAAVALAERVAAERGEACRLGDGDVGYSVRLERRGSSRTRLEFCTVGVLLRRLQRGGAFDATHVVVDEAHERDVLTDFLLVVLKTRVLPACPGLKVVVMSATLNAALFADYFGGAAVLDIPGRLHDVAVRYVDEAAALVKKHPAKASRRALEAANRHAKPPASIPEAGDDGLAPAVDGPIDVDFVCAVVAAAAAAATNDDGAILVFAPGAAEIDNLVRELRRSLGDGAWVLPMHGGLTSRDQHRVFQRPPPGARKVVVATNVAETSITIDDVDCVVDLGRVKELRYVSATDVSALAEVYTSRAAATQRAGRAGRVRAGACYRLYPRKLHDEGLPAHTAPEMLRTPLADVVLKVLRLGFGGPQAFLAGALQPPRPESVDAALRDLVAVGAVAGGAPPEEVREASDDDDDEAPEQDGDLFSLGAGVQGLLMGDSSDDSDGDDDGAAPADDGEAWVLTPLGRHVADLPMDCRVAKLLIYGAIFGAAEPCLTLAAGMSLPKGVFVAPFHKRKEAAAAKRRFARGSESDLLAVVGAYEARGALDRRDVPGFCRDHFLHMAALGDLTGLRNQFRGHLRDAGLLGDEEAVTLDETSSLLRGLLCAGLYPHVARLAGDAPHLKCRDRSKWWCHPQSLNFETLAPRGKLKERKTTYVVYNARLKTSKPYLLDTSVVHPLALLLFGGALRESLDGTRVVLDGWLPFKATKHAQLAVLALRGEIDALLAAAVDADARARPAAEAQRRLVVAAVRNLLAMFSRRPET